jgi:hypothetical protein
MGSETLFEIGLVRQFARMLLPSQPIRRRCCHSPGSLAAQHSLIASMSKTQTRTLVDRFWQGVSQQYRAEDARSTTSMRASEQWDIRQFMLYPAATSFVCSRCGESRWRSH